MVPASLLVPFQDHLVTQSSHLARSRNLICACARIHFNLLPLDYMEHFSVKKYNYILLDEIFFIFHLDVNWTILMKYFRRDSSSWLTLANLRIQTRMRGSKSSPRRRNFSRRASLGSNNDHSAKSAVVNPAVFVGTIVDWSIATTVTQPYSEKIRSGLSHIWDYF